MLHRITVALVGGSAFNWGFAALGMISLFLLGMPTPVAEHLSLVLAFLVQLWVFLWALNARRLTRVWIALPAAGILMAIAAAWLESLAHAG